MRSDIQDMPARLSRVLYGIRWVVIIGILLESRLEFTSSFLNRANIFAAALAMAALTLAVGLRPQLFAKAATPGLVLAADLAFVSAVVYESDGLQSPFYPLYYIVVITAAVTVSARAAGLTAAAATAILIGIEMSEGHRSLSETLVIDDVLRTFPYLFLISVISGALMDRIRALDETNAVLREDRARTESEMAIARQVQQAQLPAHLPQLQGLEIAAIYDPAREVGGDIYDFYPIEAHRVGVMVADVMGKGVPAALLVAGARYAVREHYSGDIAATIRGASEHIRSITGDETFVALTYGLLDLKSRQFRYVNAGGMPPIVVRGDGRDVATCDHSDLPVGIEPAPEYEERSVHLKPGDTLVLYTDGLTDALGGPVDGLSKLTQILSELGGLPLSEWRDELTKRMRKPERVDDLTAVAMRIS